MSDELKPCAHCGADAELRCPSGLSWWVQCSNKACGMATKIAYSDEPVITAWNNRAAPVPQPQEARDAEVLRIADAMESVAGPGAPYASASVPRYAVLGWVEQIRSILWRPDPPPAVDRRIVCAAIRHSGTGLVVCGARHFDDVMRGQLMALDGLGMTDEWDEQGFIDQRGNFLTREEAFAVASAAGQIMRRCGGDDGRLFSENLY